MTVFVVHKPFHRPNGPTYDVSSAGEYGDIEFVFNNNFQPYTDPKRAMDMAWDKLSGFDSDNDYILQAGGDPIAMAIVCMVISRLTGGEARLLRWDRARDPESKALLGGRYIPISLSISAE